MKDKDVTQELTNLNEYLSGTTGQHHFKNFPQLEEAQIVFFGESAEDLDDDRNPFTTERATKFELYACRVTISGDIPNFGPTHWHDDHGGDQPRPAILEKVFAHVVQKCGNINWEATK